MMFSKRIRLLLHVQEDAGTISFRDACGRSFALYEGSWRVAEANGETVIVYELNAKPSFSVPDFLLARLMKRDAKEMIDRLQVEIAARSADRRTAALSSP